jgi:hypothetical protein
MENYNEIWRQVDGYENYYVSNHGRVKNINTEKMMKCSVNVNGYCNVRLSKNNISTLYRVHRLVAENFIPNPDNKLCVDHIDNNKQNNNVNNLRWATQQENNRNCIKRSNTSSQYKGVYFHKQCRKWKATIQIDGKKQHLGLFENEIAAAKAYNEKAKELYGDYAKINNIL